MAGDVEMANDEGADPTSDIAQQNDTSSSTAEKNGKDDPHKIEKLTKAGDPDKDPDAGSD